jgi:radical SAM-linked protein
MNIRARFTKKDYTKFVGHLDTIRLFQRALKMTRVPIAYSQGFNPHSLIYFALPLPVGMASQSEYFEIVTEEEIDIPVLQETLNAVLPEGIRVLEMWAVPKQKESLMSLVHAASYKILFSKEDGLILEKIIKSQCEKEQWIVEKKTKKGPKEVDIKPLVHTLEWDIVSDVFKIEVLVNAGSTLNLSPEHLLEALTLNTIKSYSYCVIRTDLYTQTETGFVSLRNAGVKA